MVHCVKNLMKTHVLMFVVTGSSLPQNITIKITHKYFTWCAK